MQWKTELYMKGALVCLAGFGAVAACTDDPISRSTGVTARPPTPTFVLFGTVRDEDGLPMANVVAEIVSPPYEGRVSISNASGYFSFAGIAGSVTVRAYRDGFDRYVQTFTITGDMAIDVRLSRVQLADSLRLGQTIESAVFSGAEPCDPIRWDATAPCRRFLFNTPRSGTLAIVITWDGFQALDATIVTGNNRYVATSTQIPGYKLVLVAPVDANETYEIRVNSYYAGQSFLLRADFTTE